MRHGVPWWLVLDGEGETLYSDWPTAQRVAERVFLTRHAKDLSVQLTFAQGLLGEEEETIAQQRVELAGLRGATEEASQLRELAARRLRQLHTIQDALGEVIGLPQDARRLEDEKPERSAQRAVNLIRHLRADREDWIRKHSEMMQRAHVAEKAAEDLREAWKTQAEGYELQGAQLEAEHLIALERATRIRELEADLEEEKVLHRAACEGESLNEETAHRLHREVADLKEKLQNIRDTLIPELGKGEDLTPGSAALLAAVQLRELRETDTEQLRREAAENEAEVARLRVELKLLGEGARRALEVSDGV
jgi:hypothetical protein